MKPFPPTTNGGNCDQGGYTGKVLRVDLGTRRTNVEEVRERDIDLYLGARGFGAAYYYRELDGSVAPLGAENTVYIFTGPLTGTTVTSSTKTGIATRSPETGQYTCSNAGGYWGYRLKVRGYDGVILEGKASEPVALVLDENGLRFLPASGLQGKLASTVERTLQAEVGRKDMSVLCTGPAAGHVLTQEMLDEYYALRGWDAEGVPTQAGLAKFGIEKEI